MGPKGIGPQKLGVGQMSSQKSDCCGIPNCGCGKSPAKIAPLVAAVAPAIASKLMEKK
jgi:hypothetical protein